MKHLFREVHRRSMWQVLGLYVAASWLVLQVVDVLADNMALPEWVFPVSVVLLLIGLPVVLATAFVQGGARGSVGRSAARVDPAGAATAIPAAGPAPYDEASPDAASTPAPPVPRSPRVGGWLTWKNAVAGGAGAFALLGLGVGGWLGARALGIGPAGTLVAKGLLEDRARVVIADFSPAGGDSALARTVTEAFRIDFAESPVVRVADAATVVDALGRMERAPETPLDADLARELAQREGFAAVIAGEVGRAGSEYLLTARVIGAGDGSVLASHRETADEDDLLSAIDALSRRLRERIGESLGSLASAGGLERVTTSSFDALQKYTEAERAMTVTGNRARGIALLEEAIALDSTFAMAHRKLGIALYILFEQRDRQIASFTRAFQLRDRLSDTERYITEGTYYTYATGELEKAVTAYENVLAADPENPTALTNLGLVYDALGDHERALELFERTLAIDSVQTNPYVNGLFTLTSLGRYDEARTLLDRYAANVPDQPGVDWYGGVVLASQGDYEAADESLRRLLEEETGSLQRQADGHSLLAATAAARGRLAEAREHLRRVVSISRQRGLPGEVWEATVASALFDLYVRGDPGAAAAVVDSVERTTPLSEVTPFERPYWALATIHAEAGRLSDARRYLEALETEVWPLAQGDLDVRWQYRWARGAVRAAEGDADGALQEYRAIDEGYCRLCRHAALARGFARAGMPDSARVHYMSFVDETAGDRILVDRHLLGHALERAARLSDEAGELDAAIEYLARFVELWADADEELQPRVHAAQDRLETLVRERG